MDEIPLNINVIVNSDLDSYKDINETIINPLKHAGIFYKIIDIAKNSDIDLPCVLFLFCQDGLTSSISSKMWVDIFSLIKNGSGLFCMDSYLDKNLMEFLHADTEKSKKIDTLIINNNHYITAKYPYNYKIKLLRPLKLSPLYMNKTQDNNILVNTGQGNPLFITTKLGNGKLCISTISPRIWIRENLGHGAGIDSIFYKGIIWASSKPFIMQALPPFVTVRIDDAIGFNNFYYIDSLNKYNYCPHIGLDIDSIYKKSIDKIKYLYQHNKAEFSAHAFSSYKFTSELKTHLIYMKYETKEYSEEELKKNFKKVNDFFKNNSIKPSKILNPHCFSYGLDSISYLKQMGIEYSMSPFLPGETLAPLSFHYDWNPKPYGKYSFITDFLPVKDSLFVINSLKFPEPSYKKLQTAHFKINVKQTSKIDFLFGLNRITKFFLRYFINKVADNILLALDSLFWGTLFTHEHYIEMLNKKEFEFIIEKISDKLYEKYNIIPKSYDYIAEYIKNKFICYITEAFYDKKSNNIKCTFKEPSSIPFYLYLFLLDNGNIKEVLIEMPEAKKEIKINLNSNLSEPVAKSV